MHPVLRLYEDVLSSAENVEFRLAALPRFIFVVHGSVSIDGKALKEGEAWQGSAATTVKPGPDGVTCWRWEQIPTPCTWRRAAAKATGG